MISLWAYFHFIYSTGKQEEKKKKGEQGNYTSQLCAN